MTVDFSFEDVHVLSCSIFKPKNQAKFNIYALSKPHSASAPPPNNAELAKVGLGALLLWGAGLWWLFTAVFFTLRYRTEGLPFNLGWWGFTFPLGVYTVATLGLNRVTGFAGFAAIGIVLAMLLGGLWLVVLSKTLRELARGQLFHAPCLVPVR
ncbi:hypothetical protein [Paraburkholderia sp. BL10I2N1]|uniref:SLAC1 family transporter n=1 Tax=Paraburkholderia sp. BL10I2N1 TaxID=1938796 RepID=UPI001060BE27